MPGYDRRSAPRHRPPRPAAWIGWRDGQEFRHEQALLLDISLGGCLVGLLVAPPAGSPLLLRLAGDLLRNWFEVRLLDIRPREAGGLLARLEFPDTCPYELFMAAVYGLASAPTSAARPPSPSPPASARDEYHPGAFRMHAGRRPRTTS